MTKTSELIDEVLENFRQDRVQLAQIRDKMIQHGTASETDPYVVAKTGERLAMITDAMTKMNQQMIELIKISKENDRDDKSRGYGENIFDEIQSGDVILKE